MDENYKKQVSLLLEVLPFVAEEENLALHGGTAINLFVRNMPRLSVDVDLTYIPVEDRDTSLRNIAVILERIQARLESRMEGVSVEPRVNIGKLFISKDNALVKLEVNLVGRGTYKEPEKIILCERTQEEFDVFVEMKMVPMEQLYGGKICAAIDRQHPRDLFDIKYLLENEGFTEKLKAGFIYCLLGSERPIYEMLNPHRLNQQEALLNQFDGMTSDPFTYEDYERTKEKLIGLIQGSLTQEDKKFLIEFKELRPDWSIYPYEQYPSIRWKLVNLQKLKDKNPNKYNEQLNRLKEFLNT